tara:strand:+ start:89 stop:238 length:150 start_codon:yes stop_codon:yes gene_type:complete
MGRVTQFIDFINRKKMPSEDEQATDYSHISITEELKRIRKRHRKNKEKE